MNIYRTSLFPFVAGDSLVNKPVTLTMKSVKSEAVPVKSGRTEDKLVLYFEETPKGMILNKTNAKEIGQLYGGETDQWTGKPIELYSERIKAFGQEHNAVRVREAKKGKRGKAQPTPAELRERRKRNVAMMRGAERDDPGIEEPEVVEAEGLDDALEVLEETQLSLPEAPGEG